MGKDKDKTFRFTVKKSLNRKSLPTCQKILCSADHVLPLYSLILDRKDWTKNKSQRGEDLSIIFLLVCSTLLVVVQSLSQVWLFVIPWTAACQASLSFTTSQSLLKLVSVELVMSPKHLILIFFCLQSFPASRSFPMSWLFEPGGQSIGASALVFPMNTQDWFPLWLTVPADQGTVRSLLQSLLACDINHIVHSRSGRIV